MTAPSPKRRGRLWPLSVAPMMGVTDRHYRFFMRQITRHTLLYTPMITTGALLEGDGERFLDFSEEEHPVALQLGGENPLALARCAALAEQWNYDEVNLNVGCPSPRVSTGSFGASLMLSPERVRDAVAAMREACTLPVTVKTRIGVDEKDRYEDLVDFVRTVEEAGCDRFTIHARKAWLSGLSPKENRTAPPLRYAEVHRLKAELSHLAIEINGGFLTLDAAQEQLSQVDGVMMGRAAENDAYLFAEADRRFFGSREPPTTRRAVVYAMLPYIRQWLDRGERLHRLVRPMQSLFAGQRGARAWRRFLSVDCQRPEADSAVFEAVLDRLPDESKSPLGAAEDAAGGAETVREQRC